MIFDGRNRYELWTASALNRGDACMDRHSVGVA